MKSVNQCELCSSLGAEYVCPRCSRRFCSLKCYRSTMHKDCSEKFYRENVEKELCIQHDKSNKILDFESYMREKDAEVQPSTSGDSNDDEFIGEPWDSDDDPVEDVDYLEKVKEETLANWENDIEDEIERSLIARGVGVEPDQLYAVLNDDERKGFKDLVKDIEKKMANLNNSVFRKPKSK